MKIKTWIKYERGYIPPRCRKPRYTEEEEYVDMELREVGMEDMTLAFEDNSYDGKGKIYAFESNLWCKAKLPNEPILEDLKARGHEVKTALEYLAYCNEYCSTYFRFAFDRTYYGKDTSRDGVIKAAEAAMRERIVVDGDLYEKTSEPRYCIYTFGLGCNHGGTSLSVDYGYNHNIGCGRYFSALDAERAVAEANRIAKARGDTNDEGRFTADIVVHRPELVRVDPQKDYGGEGNSLLNECEEVIQAAGDPLTAGLLIMAQCAKEV